MLKKTNVRSEEQASKFLNSGLNSNNVSVFPSNNPNTDFQKS